MKENKNVIFKGILIFLIGILLGFFIGNYYEEYQKNAQETENEKVENTKSEENKRIFTKTFHILNIAQSNDGDYLYITIREFQQEEVETVKIKKEGNKDLEENNTPYEFTFQKESENIKEDIKSIFENCILLKVEKTKKLGLDQTQENIN